MQHTWPELPKGLNNDERKELLYARIIFEDNIHINKEYAYNTYILPAIRTIVSADNKEDQLLFCKCERKKSLIEYERSRQYAKWGLILMSRSEFDQRNLEDSETSEKHFADNAEQIKQITIEYINASFDKFKRNIENNLYLS